MKKLLSITAIIISVMFLSSCDNNDSQNNQEKNRGTSQESGQSQEQNQETKQLKTSFEDLSKMAQNMKCDYTTKTKGISIEGTVFTSKEGLLRVEQRMENGGRTDLIIKDDWIYAWSDLSKSTGVNTSTIGTKFKMETIEAMSKNMGNQGEQNYQINNLGKEMKMDCSDWSVDESKFKLPGEVNFMEMNLPN